MSRRKRSRRPRERRPTGGPGPAGEARGARSNARATWIAALCLVALSLGLYWPVGGHGAVSFDDPAYVTGNPQVLSGLTAESVVWALTQSHSNNWHPLTWMSHMLDVDLFGEDVGRHHLVSVALHGLAAALLLLFLQTATRRFGLALFVATVFAVHPLNVESVAWLAERKSTLSAVFFFAVLYVWSLRARRLAVEEGRPSPGLYLVSLALAAAGLMSKPMLVTLPFVLLLLDLWPLGRWPLWPGPLTSPGPAAVTSWRRLLAEKIPFFALTLGSILLTLRAQQDVVQSTEVFSLGERLSNAVLSYLRYPLMVVAPHDLAIFYPYRAVSLAVTLTALAGLALVTAVCFRLRHRYPAALFGWLWYLGLLVPVIGIVQVGLQSHADRYAYLPMVGLLVGGLFWLGEPKAWSGRGRAIGAAVAVLVIGFLAWRTREQIPTWRDDLSLYGHAAAVVEGSFWAQYNLGLTQMRAGLLEPSRAAFEEARRLDPDNVETLLNLGHVAKDRGDLPAAVELFAEAVALRPSDRSAALDLAKALLDTQRPDAAEELLESIVADHASFADAWALLGTTRVQQGHMAEAEAPLRRAVELDADDAVSQNALGVSLAQRGRFAEALPFFARASELQPDFVEARSNLEAARALAEGRPPP